MSLVELITDAYSYATLDEADKYFSARLNSEIWEQADTIDKRKALTHATSTIDLLRFRSYKTSTTQNNEFPRGGDTTIPVRVMQATCEIAKALIDGADPEIIYENVSMAATNYQNIKTSYKDRTEEYKVSGIPSMVAFRLLAPYIADPRELSIN